MKSSPLNGATLVFDLDGTLVDTAPDLLRTLNHVLTGIDCPPVSLDDIRPMIGFGARRMLKSGLAASGRPVDDAEMDRLLAVFLDHYGANVAVESRPYPGAVDFLERAAAGDIRLALCTNKYENLSRELLKELDLARFFHAVAGRDTLPVCKPDPGHLRGAVAMAGGDMARAVMIGDSGTDIATAKAAGAPVIAVSFGYSEQPLEPLEPDRIIDHYDALNEAILGVLPAG